ncbi:hypothetical protein BKA56DRAFT_578418 [Ilyonectria sp. MPI-CAGE-AT-0026]|nr:hypothetical protein BKA56DRAFT_578418 [Ilyonectria sp. MPI-CAGE-AT-0026]
MFYQPGNNAGTIPHNLPHDPFKACVVPRPIGWISPVSVTDPDKHNIVRGGIQEHY